MMSGCTAFQAILVYREVNANEDCMISFIAKHTEDKTGYSWFVLLLDILLFFIF